ncbi:SDR family NAD(P)-dependent oxidoreductase [Saccharothrix syringae]|uniref:SDR family NAD(P)-dependent oxidoreductase n=1 Tax=Saccharothrix syringae TaxID=103733 RepID=A0A5Q0GWX6_SACSY|nr:SDR family NAD(P)-dependent oxidoreductase [Saccharothrix syringae]QFZ18479.1 SDR family NAD(P)-dependent oxidoreductase [Saccharothrix syringae]
MGYFDGKVAVVTGAGAGIGRALAIELSRRGARVAVSDRDGVAVLDTARRCESVDGHVRAETVDVTDSGRVLRYADAVKDEFGRVDMVFTVAGIIHRGSLLDSEMSDIARIMAVNWGGTVHTTKAFLPHVIASPSGHIVTFSSAFGLMATPRYSAYNSSKFAVRGFSESLRQEMIRAGHGVSVTCVYPGGVRTSIVRNGLFAATENREAATRNFESRVARTEPERAAAIILRGVERRRARVLVGTDARVVSTVVHALGGSYQNVMPVTDWLLGLPQRMKRRRAE